MTVPSECDPGHVYHLFVVRAADRDALQSHFSNRGIETLVHYPIPIPDQPAFSSTGPATAGRCKVAAQVCNELLSLPLYPALADRDAQAVIDAATAFFEGPA
jgi:dTDP-4-amino-4,6-dideoxygalactose transaminase